MTLRTSLRDALARTAGPPRLAVVSDWHVGAALATAYDSVDVRLVTDHAGVAGQVPDGVRVTVGDLTAVDTLQGATDAAAAVVALRSDRRALLVTQLLRTQFDIDSVVVLLNDPQRRDAIADLASAVVCGSTCLATELQRTVETTLGEAESV
ncbi:potassium transporter [Halomicroarcula sp. GCM10025324]|uniref:potassium transporter n=1 Tax=Haloarcula TaxID=2237 RepID=UPI0023E8A189|nr:potassium transporter [Halomicroarcula sp. ZS-22-S1]